MIVDYSNCIKTMKESSNDEASAEYVTECGEEVVDFDLFTDKFFRYFDKSPRVPESVDSMCKIDGEWYLIEFKNGEVRRKNIYAKLAHSLLVLMRNESMSIDEAVRSINFILVLNKSKDYIADCIMARAGEERVLYNLKQFQGCYFKEVHTFSKRRFEEFIEGKTIEIPN